MTETGKDFLAVRAILGVVEACQSCNLYVRIDDKGWQILGSKNKTVYVLDAGIRLAKSRICAGKQGDCVLGRNSGDVPEAGVEPA